jgi:hypothetical protein
MAGVKLVENLASFTDAYGTNKNFKKRDKNVKVNPWADAGSLSQDKYFDPDPKSGSSQWKGLLDDENPEVRDNEFYRNARSFITPDEKGFKPADDAYKRWEGYAFNDFGPGNKSGPLADRIDTQDVQSFYDTYYASRLVDDETFVGSSNLRYMFEEPANAGSSEANPNEANVSPSQGVQV